MAKPALGKGFDALINQNLSRESLAAPQAGDVVHQLSHAAIIPSSLQPRAIFTPEQLAELVDSIKEHGIIQPLIVRETQNGKYELIAGERRWRASGILWIFSSFSRSPSVGFHINIFAYFFRIYIC